MSAFNKLKENEREARRDIIINATLKLFEKKPFHEIGMRDIALEVDIAPASIYRYFPSRDELFVETLIQDIKKVEQQFEKRAAFKSFSHVKLCGTRSCRIHHQLCQCRS